MTAKFTETYTTLSDNVLFPMADVLLETNTKNWKALTEAERAEWTERTQDFFDEKQELMHSLFDEMASKKCEAFDRAIMGVTAVQNKIGMDQLSEDYYSMKEEQLAEIEDLDNHPVIAKQKEQAI